MKDRRRQRGFIALQTVVILGSAILGGMVALPVWVSQAAAPQGAVIAVNLQAVSTIYEQGLIEDDGSSTWSTPSPETASALSASLKHPVVNQISHSTAIVGGELPQAGEPAPAVWITASVETSEELIVADRNLVADLAGTIVVHVGSPSLEVYAVSESGTFETL
jgi:hypothetical protein